MSAPELLRYRALVANLVAKDLKLKYRGSALGVAWSLLNPLLLMGVYTVAFRYVMRIPMEGYPFFLLSGLLPWTFFAAAASGSTSSVVGNGQLLRKAYFPAEALPLATVLFALAQLLLALAVLLPVLFFAPGVRLGWTALALPLLLALHLVLATGVALALSALTTSFRDVGHLTEVALLLLFWLTPIVYPASMAPAALQRFFSFSPPAAFATAYQDLLFWGRLPEAVVLANVLTSPFVVLLAGHRVFSAYRRELAESV